MITENEINISNKSYIHKDFYQIYPEILDLVTKITSRWDPQSSNESDPGVVLLKLLAFIADKNNYNIDKNILECFMPSCTQEESMRKLCDMMGYNMHYYRSATTQLTFMYQGADLPTIDEQKESGASRSIILPKFTKVTNEDKDIYFITTEAINLNRKYEQKTVEAIEGELYDVKIGSDNVLHLENLDDARRIYLPESQIAENGIWVTYADIADTGEWRQTYNLNTEYEGSRVWKFGFDSRKRLPYLQFPQDIASLIKNGLSIKYVRTKGITGNVSAKTLTSFPEDTHFELRGSSDKDTSDVIDENGEQVLIVSNVSAAVNGANYETIDEAYNGFKKVVGTFDTLVTCRDYANAIYNMVSGADNTTPLVGNVQVADIRDNLNRTYRIMTFNDFGLCFSDVAKAFEDPEESGRIIPAATHFDLFIYPFNMITGTFDSKSYQKSFQPGFAKWYEIQENLKDNKTISHNITSVNTKSADELFCIKAYYRLKAAINTTYKVNKYEEKQILDNVYQALYQRFNSRKVDFGEELVYEDILSTIEKADSRIKNISLDDPEIVMKTMGANGEEHPISNAGEEAGIYEELILKNILAGRLELLNYDKNFNFEFGQVEPGTGIQTYYGSEGVTPHEKNDPEDAESAKSITSIKSVVTIPGGTNDYTLRKNENIICAAPNLESSTIYPVGVNYYLHLDDETKTIAKDSEYRLGTGDILYILYTNTDGVVMHIKYTATAIITNGSTKPVEQNIIRANFELKDSSEVKKTAKKWQKTLDVRDIWSQELDGMWTCTAQEQIAIRDFVQDTLKTSTPIYWLTKSGSIENGQILETGEYFFYTDENKTVLYTFGSGTKILFAGNPEAGQTLTLDKSLIKDNLNIDDVANYGIAAFADTPWYQWKPAQDGLTGIKEITVREMQLIILGEDDVISNKSSIDLTNDWQEIESNKFAYKDQESLPILPADINWQIRSRLNINMGPELTQTLSSKDGVTQSFTLQHQRYYFDVDSETGERIYKYDSNIIDLTVEPLENDISLRCNYLIQEPGGNNVSTTITEADGTVTNDLKIQVFKLAPCTAVDVDESSYDYTKLLYNYDNYYSKVDSSIKELTLPVLADNEHFGILMIYVSSSNGDEGDDSRSKISCDFDTISFYNSAESGTELTLKIGLNTIKVNKSCNLIIKKDSEETITFSKYRLVLFDDTNFEGINLDTLRITDPSNLLSDIKAIEVLSGKHFYYNAPLDNSMLINADDMLEDYNVWFDYNNLVNKFVICELDTGSFADIKLTKQSRLQ